MHVSPRYSDDVLAWEYDQRQPSPLPGELEWYLANTRRVGGPVLELTCGSGRLTIPIARAGYEIDGVDSSGAMLRRLNEKLMACDLATRERVRTFCVDMLRFPPDRMYSIVILPYNSLQYLETRERVAALFSRAFASVRVGGLFLFDVRRINAADYAKGEKTVIDWLNKPVVDEKTGISVGSRFVSSFDRAMQRLANHRTYIVRRGDGSEKMFDFVTYAPVITVQDYLGALENAGFKARATSGYDGLADDGVSREICFVCETLCTPA